VKTIFEKYYYYFVFVVFFQEWESSALMLESSFSEVKARNTGNLASNENEEAINFYP